MKKVMFVCSGNTCRSPMGEGLLKAYLIKNNIDDVEVLSAGTSVFPGDPVSINSVLAMGNRGIDISEHRARQLNPQNIMETDLFVCMSESHAKIVGRFVSESQIMVLSVNDPYGRSLETYEECARQIELSLKGIIEKLKDLEYIRPMDESAVSEIANIEKDCFSEPWSENSLNDELSNPTARFYVIKKEQEILGYIGANNIADEIYITNIAVKEKYRRNGYGQRLLSHLILEGVFEKANFISLEVRKSNENAINLYEKLRFKNVGERKNFYKNPQEDGYIYTLYLKDR